MLAIVTMLFACGSSAPPETPPDEAPPATGEAPATDGTDPDAKVPTKATPASGKSHCAEGEKVVFSCDLTEKEDYIVSLCASAEVTADAGTLTYHFGKEGAVELKYPDAPAHPTTAFKYATENIGPRMSSSSWAFSNGDWTYVLSDSFVQGEQNNELTVKSKDGSYNSWLCKQPAVNDFGALHALDYSK